MRAYEKWKVVEWKDLNKSSSYFLITSLRVAISNLGPQLRSCHRMYGYITIVVVEQYNCLKGRRGKNDGIQTK